MGVLVFHQVGCSCWACEEGCLGGTACDWRELIWRDSVVLCFFKRQILSVKILRSDISRSIALIAIPPAVPQLPITILYKPKYLIAFRLLFLTALIIFFGALRRWCGRYFKHDQPLLVLDWLKLVAQQLDFIFHVLHREGGWWESTLRGLWEVVQPRSVQGPGWRWQGLWIRLGWRSKCSLLLSVVIVIRGRKLQGNYCSIVSTVRCIILIYLVV